MEGTVEDSSRGNPNREITENLECMLWQSKLIHIQSSEVFPFRCWREKIGKNKPPKHKGEQGRKGGDKKGMSEESAKSVSHTVKRFTLQ